MDDNRSLDRPDFLSTTPESVAARLESSAGEEVRTAVVLEHALRYGVTHGDVELVRWLVGLEGRLAAVLDSQVEQMEDEEGWGVVGMAIQASCGRSDKEEVVRLVVGRWGVHAGPRGGCDRGGWTALHLAALLSSPQTVSVLLNRGASPSTPNLAGLTPYDLVSGMEGRESLAVLLDPVGRSAPPTPATASGSFRQQQDIRIPPERRALLQRRRLRIATRSERTARRAERARIAMERERWVRERAKFIGVDASVLFPPAEPPRQQEGEEDDPDDDDSEDQQSDQDDADEMDVDEALGGLDPGSDLDATLLVFSLHQLPAIFDVLISSYRPVCQPRVKRALPANALYLYARFAHYRCDEVWLEELLIGAVEQIETVVYDNNEDLAALSFWEYNLTLLLYLVRSDKELSAACLAGGNMLVNFEELINAIHVFIIRIAERKIDEVLEPAMLDFESLEDFDGVRFQDEWNIFRSFGKKNKREPPLATAMFSLPNSPAKGDSPSTSKSHHRGLSATSIQDLRAAASAAKDEAKGVIANGIATAQAMLGDKPSPRKISDILTNVLLLLQLYEVNPAFIVQVFSQTFFWISSELFNRVITRKKYLCRTKALQIRMNITALEDWPRANGLPPNIASRHFVPIMQLLQWLQCVSQINEFDMLIGTVQGLRHINPMQMRRAVQNYRYEVNEGRMADDCLQYLHQLVRDWEKRRVHIGVKESSGTPSDAERSEPGSNDDFLPIEALFDGSVALNDWVPQSGPDAKGELLDSRYMLPFLVPQEAEYLLATPPPDAAFRNLMTERPLLPDGSIRSRPLSSASHSSSQPLGWVSLSNRKVRELPEDFFSWMKEQQHSFMLRRDGQRTHPARQDSGPAALAPPPKSATTPRSAAAVGSITPLQAHEDMSTPTKTRSSAAPLVDTPNASTPLATLSEDRELTPSATSRPTDIPTPKHTPFKQLERRASAELKFRPSPDRSSASPENIELRTRDSDGSLNGQANGHYELARHRRERGTSISSISSVSSAEKKRWWNKGGNRNVSNVSNVSTASDDIPLRQLRDNIQRQDTDETIRTA